MTGSEYTLRWVPRRRRRTTRPLAVAAVALSGLALAVAIYGTMTARRAGDRAHKAELEAQEAKAYTVQLGRVVLTGYKR